MSALAERREALKQKEKKSLVESKMKKEKHCYSWPLGVQISEQRTDYPTSDFKNIKKEFDKLAGDLKVQSLSLVVKKLFLLKK